MKIKRMLIVVSVIISGIFAICFFAFQDRLKVFAYDQIIPGVDKGEGVIGKYCFFGHYCFNGWPSHTDLLVKDMGDKDEDGILNVNDKCPDVKYVDPPDSTGDPTYPDGRWIGCPDEHYSCGNKFHGCPDTDGDGLHDGADDDPCPFSPDPTGINGCPTPSIVFGFDTPDGKRADTIEDSRTIQLCYSLTVPDHDKFNPDKDKNKNQDLSKYYVSVSINNSEGFVVPLTTELSQCVPIGIGGTTTYTAEVTAPKGIDVKSTPIIMTYEPRHGGWSAPSECSAKCGNGVLTKTCTNPAPNSLGNGCPLDAGGRLVDKDAGGRIMKEELDCSGPAPCSKKIDDLGCLTDEQYNSVAHCPSEEEGSCSGKNQLYSCTYKHWGVCWPGTTATLRLRCEVPVPEDAKWEQISRCNETECEVYPVGYVQQPGGFCQFQKPCGGYKLSYCQEARNGSQVTCAKTAVAQGCTDYNAARGSCKIPCAACPQVDCQLSPLNCTSKCGGTARQTVTRGSFHGGRSCVEVAGAGARKVSDSVYEQDCPVNAGCSQSITVGSVTASDSSTSGSSWSIGDFEVSRTNPSLSLSVAVKIDGGYATDVKIVGNKGFSASLKLNEGGDGRVWGANIGYQYCPSSLWDQTFKIVASNSGNTAEKIIKLISTGRGTTYCPSQ